MRSLWRKLVFVVGLLTVPGCMSMCGAEGNTGVSIPSTSQDQLFFAEKFERSQLGPEWVRGKGEQGEGQWQIENGWLLAYDLKNDPLWLKRRLPEQVLIRFDVKALSPVGDIKFEIFGDGLEHASGYICIFGGWENTLDVIARLDEHGDDRLARDTWGVVPNTTYEMTVFRRDKKLHWFVNGEHLMTYSDDDPLEGKGHRHFAFNNWSAPVKFDNLRIYKLD